jgi:hypothetical protein
MLTKLDSCDHSQIGDIKEGYRMSQLGFSLYEVFDSKAWLARLSALYFEFVYGWVNQMDECQVPLEYARSLGLESGDIEFAGACGVVSFYNRFEASRLHELAVERDALVDTLTQYGQQNGILATAFARQFIDNMMETNDGDPDILEGKFFSSTATSEAESLRLWGRLHQAHLKFMFCNYSEAAFLAEEPRKLIAQTFSPRSRGYLAFMLGIMDVADACERRRRRAPFAKKCSRTLRTYASWGEPLDFISKHYFLEAELAALFCNTRDAFALYTIAISTAQKGKKFLQTALANERTGRFLLRQGDCRQAERYFREAVAWYKDGGVIAKVRHLEKEMSELGM